IASCMGLVWLGMCCSHPAEVGERATTKREPLAGGVIDPDTTAVYALQVTAPTPLFCSAVLVAPTLLPTARHCVSVGGMQEVTCSQTPLGELVSPADIVLSNRLSFLDNPDSTALPTVERIEVPAGGNDVCGYDLAALLLRNQAMADVTPL